MEPLAALAPLIGTWSGPGHGVYPTIEPFDYVETVTFAHMGKPLLVYTQRTQHATTGLPLHGESGYWRWVDSGGLELVIAHPNGIAEIATGRVDGSRFCFQSIAIIGTPTAKEVSMVERDFTLEDRVLRYELRMAAVGQRLGLHLSAALVRAE